MQIGSEKHIYIFIRLSLLSNLFSLRSFCMYGTTPRVQWISSSTFFIYIVYSKCCCRWKVDLGKGLVMANTFFVYGWLLFRQLRINSPSYAFTTLYNLVATCTFFVPCVQYVIGTSTRTLLVYSRKQFTK